MLRPHIQILEACIYSRPLPYELSTAEQQKHRLKTIAIIYSLSVSMGQEFGQWDTGGMTCLCSTMSETSARKLKSWGVDSPKCLFSHVCRLMLALAETWNSSWSAGWNPPRGLSMWLGLPPNMMAGFQRWESQKREQAKYPFHDPTLDHVCFTHRSGESQVPAHIQGGTATNATTVWEEDNVQL